MQFYEIEDTPPSDRAAGDHVGPADMEGAVLLGTERALVARLAAYRAGPEEGRLVLLGLPPVLGFVPFDPASELGRESLDGEMSGRRTTRSSSSHPGRAVRSR
jgi:hypothetical protein